ncbi:Uncharacterised protein [Klebsiella pneumoniae subsp. ozaenae]|uniref:Uncharacterized protein n=1 Tax=Klebsiella pneumoniae subsp. ozaenae TaxID=574 RepID=A0A378BK29_KLEPO|nr:Uncharacterised protein [Klebsiella pneumoniae subsp. ozaenae]
MPGKRTVRRYEDENHTLTEKKTMTISLYTSRTSAPNTAAATKRILAGAVRLLKNEIFLKPERIFIRPLPTASLQRWKPV